mgnify:CR=1 FL=1
MVNKANTLIEDYNYNKKKNNWGWKAIKIDTVENTENTDF